MKASLSTFVNGADILMDIWEKKVSHVSDVNDRKLHGLVTIRMVHVNAETGQVRLSRAAREFMKKLSDRQSQYGTSHRIEDEITSLFAIIDSIKEAEENGNMVSTQEQIEEARMVIEDISDIVDDSLADYERPLKEGLGSTETRAQRVRRCRYAIGRLEILASGIRALVGKELHISLSHHSEGMRELKSYFNQLIGSRHSSIVSRANRASEKLEQMLAKNMDVLKKTRRMRAMLEGLRSVSVEERKEALLLSNFQPQSGLRMKIHGNPTEESAIDTLISIGESVKRTEPRKTKKMLEVAEYVAKDGKKEIETLPESFILWRDFLKVSAKSKEPVSLKNWLKTQEFQLDPHLMFEVIIDRLSRQSNGMVLEFYPPRNPIFRSVVKDLFLVRAK